MNGNSKAYIINCDIIQGIVQCQNCSSFQDIKESQICKKCSHYLDSKFPAYKFLFSFAITNNITITEHKAIALGRVVDSVMGFPINIFISLFDFNEQIIELVKKYFIHSIFHISFVDERIISFSLPKDNKMTFRKFLSFQPGFEDCEQIIKSNLRELSNLSESENQLLDKKTKEFIEIESLNTEIPDKLLLI